MQTLKYKLIKSANAKESINCILSGTIANPVIFSNWFVNNENTLLSAIKCCCEGSNTFYFCDGVYVFTKDIFLYNPFFFITS